MGQAVAGCSDDEVTDRADHQEQTEGIAHEPRHADHHSANENDQSVEQLASGHLPACQPFPRVAEHANAHTADDKRPERAEDHKDRQCPQEADLLGYHDEGDDLRSNDEQQSNEEHDQG